MLSKNLLIIDKLILALPDDFTGGINSALECLIQYRMTEDAMIENKGGNFVLTSFDIPDGINPDDPSQLTKEALMKYLAEHEEKVMAGVVTVAEFDDEMGGYRNRYTKQEEKTYQNRKADYLAAKKQVEEEYFGQHQESEDENEDDEEVDLPPIYDLNLPNDEPTQSNYKCQPVYHVTCKGREVLGTDNLMSALIQMWVEFTNNGVENVDIWAHDSGSGIEWKTGLKDYLLSMRTKIAMDNDSGLSIFEIIGIAYNTELQNHLISDINSVSDFYTQMSEWFQEYMVFVTAPMARPEQFWELVKMRAEDYGMLYTAMSVLPIERIFDIVWGIHTDKVIGTLVFTTIMNSAERAGSHNDEDVPVPYPGGISFMMTSPDHVDINNGDNLVECLYTYADPDVRDAYSVYAISESLNRKLYISDIIEEYTGTNMASEVERIVDLIKDAVSSYFDVGSCFVAFPEHDDFNNGTIFGTDAGIAIPTPFIIDILNRILHAYSTKHIGSATILCRTSDGVVHAVMNAHELSDLFCDMMNVYKEIVRRMEEPEE